MTKRRSAAAPRAHSRPPVVVTLDSNGQPLDVVGDIDWFVAADSGLQDLFQRLRDLREGLQGIPDIVPAVELAQGRYADVHMLAEQDVHHFVLMDATRLMLVLRDSQQASNEVALLEDEHRRSMLKQTNGATLPPRGLQPFRRSSELFCCAGR